MLGKVGMKNGGQTGYIGMFHKVEESHENDVEYSADDCYLQGHCSSYYEFMPVARFIVHHAFRRRERCERHCGEGVHDEIHPQHLSHGERTLCTDECTGKNNQASYYVHHHLEEDESLDV